jgi:uncharacterized protein (DUF2236 family)
MNSTLADINREAYIYFGAGAAVAWQMANPGVGRGVARHSTTLERPVDRLRATMSYIYAVSLGNDADRQAIRRMVDHAHAPVRGPGYSAFDPDLQLWVAATLYRGAADMYGLFVGPLRAEAAEQLYREARAFGATLQVRDTQWPGDVAAFDAWWDAQRRSVHVEPEVRDYMQAVLRGGRTPWYLRWALPLQRFVTRALLPPDLRQAYGLTWDARDARRWARFQHWAPRLYWRLPAWLRHLPGRIVLADFRRRT